MTAEQREAIRGIQTELGITSLRDASPEQREQLRKLLVERGVIAAPAAPGETVITTRTVYRLPKGNKLATPEPVSIKVGITDGSTSEVVSGLEEGDVIITGIVVTSAATPGSPAGNSPFGSGRRF